MWPSAARASAARAGAVATCQPSAPRMLARSPHAARAVAGLSRLQCRAGAGTGTGVGVATTKAARAGASAAAAASAAARLPWQPLQRSWFATAVPAAAAGETGAPVVVPPTTGQPSNTAAAFVSGASFRESREQVGLSERQEAFLIERLPLDFEPSHLMQCCAEAGLDLGEDWQNKILVMRSRLGRSIGRMMVLSSAHLPHIKHICPPGTTYRAMDRNDVVQFVEQCERFVDLSDDLRRLARPEYFQRIITITEVPESYGRQDIAYVIKERCGVVVKPQDIVFRFKRWGRQSDTCYVICPTAKDADHCVAQIQELAVPKKAAYGSLFGAAFLWSSRATLFLSDPALDFVLDSRYWVFTTGWQESMSADDLLGVLRQLKFRPTRAVRHYIPSDKSAAFFVEFEGMQRTKKAMTQLQRLKKRWRVKQDMPFFAYPRRIDIHRESEERFEDEDSAEDSDLEEPVHY